jgi:hypothetical protein
LPDGKPLPSWLTFDHTTGKFAGNVPDDIITGAIPPSGGNIPQPQANVVPQTITIEVVAHDSKCNITITDFEVKLTPVKDHKGVWHMVPSDPKRLARDAGIDADFGLQPTDVTLPNGEHVLWHAEHAFDKAGAETAHMPSGRIGFSDQLKHHGMHAMRADRLALLESFRQLTR